MKIKLYIYIYIYIYMNLVSSASMRSTRKRRFTEAESHLESLLVVCCSGWMTILCVALGRHIIKAWRDYGRGSSLESGTGCCRTGLPFSEDAILLSSLIEGSRLT